jgi:hypothetical protein
MEPSFPIEFVSSVSMKAIPTLALRKTRSYSILLEYDKESQADPYPVVDFLE